jgi:hypothetical protein
LCDRRFKSDEEVKAAVRAWLHGLAAVGYGEGTQKLVTGYGKSLNVGGDYIERERRVCNSAAVNLFLLLFCLFFFIQKLSLLSP